MEKVVNLLDSPKRQNVENQPTNVQFETKFKIRAAYMGDNEVFFHIKQILY